MLNHIRKIRACGLCALGGLSPTPASEFEALGGGSVLGSGFPLLLDLGRHVEIGEKTKRGLGLLNFKRVLSAF